MTEKLEKYCTPERLEAIEPLIDPIALKCPISSTPAAGRRGRPAGPNGSFRASGGGPVLLSID